MKAAWIRLLGLLLVISIGVYGDGCSSCNLFNKIYEETLVTVQGVAPQVVFTSSNQGQPLIILPTYNRTEYRAGLSLLLCSDPYCSTYEDIEPYSMSIPSGYLYSLSATAVAQDYYAVVMAQSSQVLYLICYDLVCDDYYSYPLQGSASTVQVAYNPVGDQVVVAVLHTVSGVSGTVTLYSTFSGTYTYQGVITTSFKQTGWSDLNFAGSPAGWSTLLMSANSYTLTAYFCNVTNCMDGVNAIGYLASNSTPLDYSVVYTPTDLYVPSMGANYSGSFPVIAVTYSKKPATVMFCLSQTCDKNITTSFGKSVSSVSIAYGPDNLPVVHYIDNSVLTIAHCQNVLCNSTQPNNGTGYYAPFTNTFQVSTMKIDVLNAVSSPPLTLALVQGTDINSTFYRVPFCGPFIDYMTPTEGSIDKDITVTVYGWSFCKNVTSACKFGNSSVRAFVQSSTELTCTIDYPSETDVNVMVGTRDWSLYSYVPGSFQFTATEDYPNGKIGFNS